MDSYYHSDLYTFCCLGNVLITMYQLEIYARRSKIKVYLMWCYVYVRDWRIDLPIMFWESVVWSTKHGWLWLRT